MLYPYTVLDKIPYNPAFSSYSLSSPTLASLRTSFPTCPSPPYLRPEEKHRLNYRLEEYPRYPQVFPLPDQDPRQLRPTLPILFKVSHHRRSVVIPCCHDLSQVIKLCDRF